jgi:hypothetical protein
VMGTAEKGISGLVFKPKTTYPQWLTALEPLGRRPTARRPNRLR